MCYSLGLGAVVVADMHEIHKTTQNTRDQNKTLSVLWACTVAPTLTTTRSKRLDSFFLWVALSVLQKEGLKGSRLQARSSFRSTPSLVTQSNPVPAGGCGPAPRTPFRVRVACAGTKAEAAANPSCEKKARLSN